jgi:23S rRNA pseudouridine1911/1915/1917 synthase
MTTPTLHHFTVSQEDAGRRLDKFLAVMFQDFSRTRIKGLIEYEHVTLEGKGIITQPAHKVHVGDRYTVTVPAPVPTDMQPSEIPLNIVYEDASLAVINKQADLSVHPGAAKHQDTLANALLHYYQDNLSSVCGVERPGIVHRLDKDTTGLMVIAKNDRAHYALSDQLKDRSLSRKYYAICWGVPNPKQGVITTQIGRSTRDRTKMAVYRTGGKEAVTHYAVKKILGGGLASLIECTLKTGRTHQIRVHMTHIGHSLVGDPAYGSNQRKALKDLSPETREQLQSFPRQALHAHTIGFIHPETGETMEFSVKMPEDMEGLMKLLDATN